MTMADSHPGYKGAHCCPSQAQRRRTGGGRFGQGLSEFKRVSVFGCRLAMAVSFSCFLGLGPRGYDHAASRADGSKIAAGAADTGRLSQGRAMPEGPRLTAPYFDIWDFASGPLKVARAPMRTRARRVFTGRPWQAIVVASIVFLRCRQLGSSRVSFSRVLVNDIVVW